MTDRAANRTAQDLDDVVSRAQQGSQDAFSQIVLLYQDEVRRFVRWRLGNRATADDLAQDIFVQAYRSIATFRGEGSIRSWLLGIARHHVLSHLRQVKRHPGTSLDDSLELLRLAYDEDDPVDVELRMEQLRVLQDCVSRLRKDQQHVVDQFYFANVSVAVIGTQIDRKPGAVRMLLLRIRDVLRQCVELNTTSEV
ncbi:MAG: RNA polymerase sigma factor [Rubripirellula sp.]